MSLFRVRKNGWYWGDVVLISIIFLCLSIMKTMWCTFRSILLRIKGLYMFRALFAHPQEALRKRHLVYCVSIISVVCATIAISLHTWHRQLTLYARKKPSVDYAVPPEDEQVMLETCRGPWFSINWTKSASRWFNYTDILWCTVSKTLNLSGLHLKYFCITKAKSLMLLRTALTSKHTILCGSEVSYINSRDALW
jgi:hypothetical protein